MKKTVSSGIDSALRVRSSLTIISKPDYVPFIAIFFLLILFFMLCSQFAQVSGIKVDLPETASANYAARKFVVTISSAGKLFFNDEEIPVENLRTRLAQLRTREAPDIILRADASVPYSTVARVMGIAEENGSSVILLTSTPKAGTPSRTE